MSRGSCLLAPTWSWDSRLVPKAPGGFTSRKGPSYGNPIPPRDLPPMLESSWPSRGHSAQRVGPPWLALARAQTWDLAMFPIVRFLCGSWSRGEDARL